MVIVMLKSKHKKKLKYIKKVKREVVQPLARRGVKIDYSLNQDEVVKLNMINLNIVFTVGSLKLGKSTSILSNTLTILHEKVCGQSTLSCL